MIDRNKHEMQKRFAGRITKVRLRNGPRSQRQFARDLNVFQQNVNRYENGTLPDIEFLRKMVADGINLNWLVAGHGKMPLPRAHA